MGQIVISGRTALFDDRDADLVARYHWNLHVTPTVVYARGYIHGNRRGGLVYMHRLILGAERGDEVDHRNGDGLDNRRANLRRCTRAQNNANRFTVMSASGVKGVHFEAWSGRWRAEIQHQRRRMKLGRFATRDEAAAAYAAKARELFGEYANPTQ